MPVEVSMILRKPKYDLEGQRFGSLVAIEYVGGKWKCRCDCGNVKTSLTNSLMTGRSTRCKACRELTRSAEVTGTHASDIAGKTFGAWTVLEYDSKSKWFCRCKCGKVSRKTATVVTKGGGGCGKCCRKRDLTGVQVGTWTVVSRLRATSEDWKLKCECGAEKLIASSRIQAGNSSFCLECKSGLFLSGCGTSISSLIDGCNCDKCSDWRKLFDKNGYRYQSRYGIDKTSFVSMFVHQNGKCKICTFDETTKNRTLAVDHCHRTLGVRGLLCLACNRGLGKFNDSLPLLRRSFKYLNGQFACKESDCSQLILLPQETIKRIKRIFDLTQTGYSRIYNWQRGKCAICQSGSRDLTVDHCHYNGHVRGLLCNACNSGIGDFRDSGVIVDSAVNYIRESLIQ